MIVASTIVPCFNNRPRSSSKLPISSKIVFVRSFSSRMCRNLRIVVSSGILS